MHRSIQLFLIFAIAIAGSVVAVPEADAGGFRRARSGLFFNRYRRPVRSTPVYRQSNRTIQPSYYRSRSTSKKSWPGAIGGMDPRYEFFQDINGYWK